MHHSQIDMLNQPLSFKTQIISVSETSGVASSM